MGTVATIFETRSVARQTASTSAEPQVAASAIATVAGEIRKTPILADSRAQKDTAGTWSAVAHALLVPTRPKQDAASVSRAEVKTSAPAAQFVLATVVSTPGARAPRAPSLLPATGSRAPHRHQDAHEHAHVSADQAIAAIDRPIDATQSLLLPGSLSAPQAPSPSGRRTAERGGRTFSAPSKMPVLSSPEAPLRREGGAKAAPARSVPSAMPIFVGAGVPASDRSAAHAQLQKPVLQTPATVASAVVRDDAQPLSRAPERETSPTLKATASQDQSGRQDLVPADGVRDVPQSESAPYAEFSTQEPALPHTVLPPQALRALETELPAQSPPLPQTSPSIGAALLSQEPSPRPTQLPARSTTSHAPSNSSSKLLSRGPQSSPQNPAPSLSTVPSLSIVSAPPAVSRPVATVRPEVLSSLDIDVKDQPRPVRVTGDLAVGRLPLHKSIGSRIAGDKVETKDVPATMRSPLMAGNELSVAASHAAAMLLPTAAAPALTGAVAEPPATTDANPRRSPNQKSSSSNTASFDHASAHALSGGHAAAFASLFPNATLIGAVPSAPAKTNAGAISQALAVAERAPVEMSAMHAPTARVDQQTVAQKDLAERSSTGPGSSRRDEPTAVTASAAAVQAQAPRVAVATISPVLHDIQIVGVPLPPAMPAAAAPLVNMAMEDPTLHASAMGTAAHLTLDAGPAGQLSLHLRVQDGVADVRIDGAAGKILDIRPEQLRTALAGEGITLGAFQAGTDQRVENPSASTAWTAPDRQSESAQSTASGSNGSYQPTNDSQQSPSTAVAPGNSGFASGAGFGSSHGDGGSRGEFVDPRNDGGPAIPGRAPVSQTPAAAAAPHSDRGLHVTA
jgi:hypothetical protein